jgi:hypothetical protein
MRIHLVFEPELSFPLQKVLEQQGQEITGSDVTLDQFRILTSAHPPPADVALIDGTTGIVDKRESIQMLREIRASVPEMRLIVILPESAEREWIRCLGRLGIYDIHCTSEFSAQDVNRWLERRGTIADVPPDEPATGLEKIERGTKKRLRKSVKTTVIEEKVIGSVSIGIAGIDRRCGSTHAALSLAVFLAKYGKVALIECGKPSLHVLDIGCPSVVAPDGFHVKGVDVFGCPNKEWIPLLSVGYGYVILDFGNLRTLSDETEYIRCALRFLISGASSWDLFCLYSLMEAWMGKYPALVWNVMINFADENRFRDIFGSLTSKEKKDLKLQLVQFPFHSDPLHPPSYEHILRDILPRKARRKGWVSSWFYPSTEG